MRRKRRWRGVRAGRSISRTWRPGGHDVDDHSLALFAVVGSSADEVEEARPVEFDGAVAVVEGNDRLAVIAVVVAPFVHHKYRVVAVLKYCNTQD